MALLSALSLLLSVWWNPKRRDRASTLALWSLPIALAGSPASSPGRIAAGPAVGDQPGPRVVLAVVALTLAAVTGRGRRLNPSGGRARLTGCETPRSLGARGTAGRSPPAPAGAPALAVLIVLLVAFGTPLGSPASESTAMFLHDRCVEPDPAAWPGSAAASLIGRDPAVELQLTLPGGIPPDPAPPPGGDDRLGAPCAPSPPPRRSSSSGWWDYRRRDARGRPASSPGWPRCCG